MVKRIDVIIAVLLMKCAVSCVKASHNHCRLLQENEEKSVEKRLTWTRCRAIRYWMGKHIFTCSTISPNTFFATRLAEILCNHAWRGVLINVSRENLECSEKNVHIEKSRQEYAETLHFLGMLLYNDLKSKGVYPLLWKKNEVSFEAISRFWLSGLELLDSTYDQEALVFCIRKLREGYGDHPIYERLERNMRRSRRNPCAILDYPEHQLVQEVRDIIVYEKFREIHPDVDQELIRSSEYRVNRSLLQTDQDTRRGVASQEIFV